MNVQQVFELGIKVGMAADPRGAKGVKKYLARMKKEYEDMRPKDKAYFDKENLTNPYPDSRVFVDDGKTQVKRVLAGIDISPSEIILASQLSERGKKIDLAIAHHPEGKALANLHEVMEMAVEMYVADGVPIHMAEKIMEERVSEVGRSLHPGNHYQATSTAELLEVNFMNTHTITDNLVDKFLTDYITKRKPETLGDMMDMLMEIPEYQEARRQGVGPKLFAGKPSHRVGEWVVEMTGGTEPSSKIYQEFGKKGFSTVVSMHMRKEALEKVGELQMNVVAAGHMSSDSIGMNLFLDELEKRGVAVVACGGLFRVSRVKKGKK